MSESHKKVDARKHPRHPVYFKSDFSAPGAAEGSGLIMDVSKGGCKVSSMLGVPPGTQMTLRISLKEKNLELEVKGVSRWAIGMQFGVEFLEMPPEDQDKLRRVLEEFEKLR